MSKKKLGKQVDQLREELRRMSGERERERGRVGLVELVAAMSPKEVDKDLAGELAKVAYLALQAGVRPTLADLARSPEEGFAWVWAGQRWAVDQAQAHGLAGEGDLGRALVESELDGGQAAAQATAELLASQEACDLLNSLGAR